MKALGTRHRIFRPMPTEGSPPVYFNVDIAFCTFRRFCIIAKWMHSFMSESSYRKALWRTNRQRWGPPRTPTSRQNVNITSQNCSTSSIEKCWEWNFYWRQPVYILWTRRISAVFGKNWDAFMTSTKTSLKVYSVKKSHENPS